MSSQHLVPSTSMNDNYAILIPDGAGKDQFHRLTKFVTWLDANDAQWIMPDLRAYRDHLLRSGLSPESTASHLSTIRSRYRELLLDRDLFFAFVPGDLDFVVRKALVDEVIARIAAAIDSRSAPIRTRKRQDRPDSEHLRLTDQQAYQLLSAPEHNTLAGLRDTAIIATLLCTGVREAELCAVEVRDLRQRLEGELALHIREGKGRKERLIPYGEMDWCLPIIDSWRHAAGISKGPVFRGLRKGDHVRDEGLNERTIQKILARYPIVVEGEVRIVRPHDCRRTYARWLYDAGVKIDAIRRNMGHDSVEMTFHYIGDPAVAERRPPAVFRFALR